MPWRKAIRIDGEKSIIKIPDILEKEEANNPLIVCSARFPKTDDGIIFFDSLKSKGFNYSLFTEIKPDPSLMVIESIFKIYNDNDCDSFVAIGGGSAIDAAKAAAARVVRPEKSVAELGGLLKVGKNLPVFIAVPTTAGTGSETTIAAVVTDTENHHKYSIMDLHLIPKYAILDPDLTVSLPPAVTSTTGMDALTHAIEAYLCWTLYTKESKEYAKEAIVTIIHNIEKVYENGLDVEARMQMLVASYEAGVAFTRSGVGNVHAVAHTLGGLYHTAHGLAIAVVLPVVLEEYGEKIYPQLAELAEMSGVATDGNDEQKAKKFIEKIYKLNANMGIPKGFDFIQDEDIPTMIKWALKEANPVYPVPVIFDENRVRSVVEKIRL